MSRKLDESSSKIDTAVQEVPRLSRLIEQASAEIQAATAQRDSERKEILAVVCQTNNDMRNFASEWARLGTTVSHPWIALFNLCYLAEKDTFDTMYTATRIPSSTAVESTALGDYPSYGR